MNRNKAKGTNAETAVVTFLRANLWPWCERRALAGAKDKGDIMGPPGTCVEVKAGALVELSTWMKELDVEKVNADATTAALFVKPRGKANGADYYVVMRPIDWVELMRKAGWA